MDRHGVAPREGAFQESHGVGDDGVGLVFGLSAVLSRTVRFRSACSVPGLLMCALDHQLQRPRPVHAGVQGRHQHVQRQGHVLGPAALADEREQALGRIRRRRQQDEAELEGEVDREDAFVEVGELRAWQMAEAEFGHDEALPKGGGNVVSVRMDMFSSLEKYLIQLGAEQCPPRDEVIGCQREDRL